MSDRVPSPEQAPESTSDSHPIENPEVVDAQIKVKEESPSPPSPTSPQQLQASSGPPIRHRAHKTTAQRRAYFRDDPLCGELEPHRAYCRGCEKWIKLSPNSQYSLNNWQSHRKQCSHRSPSRRRTPSKPTFSPSSRVATAERKIVLLNDPQVRSFSTTQVGCGTCKTEVALEGDIDYDLTKWNEHKETCIPMTPAPLTPEGSRSQASFNVPCSTSSTHSQGSAGWVGCEGNSDATAVGESPVNESLGGVKVGVKRGRDEDTEGEEEETGQDADVRPTNRPRTEEYKRPEQDPASLFGWLIQPIKEFVRGFREGLGT